MPACAGMTAKQSSFRRRPESSLFNHSLFCCTNVKKIYLLDAGVRRHDGKAIVIPAKAGIQSI